MEVFHKKIMEKTPTSLLQKQEGFCNLDFAMQEWDKRLINIF